MADYSTTVRGIPIRIAGGCWARRQLHAGIRYVPVASKPRISLVSVEGIHSPLAEFYSMADYSITVRGIPIRIAGGCWARRQLHAGIRYVPVASKLRISLASVEGRHSTLMEFYSMADSSTTVRGVPIRIEGGCWARCQLRNGIKYVPTP